MGHSNYKLTDEQKKILDEIAKELVAVLEDKLADDKYMCGPVDPYDTTEAFDNNKFTAMVWYIGDQLGAY